MTRKMAAIPIHAATALLAFAVAHPATAGEVTAPSAFFAQPPGSDYFLADYTAYEAYLKRLASQSDRMKLVDIGKTSEGRTQWMAIVSSPANLAKLEYYRDIARRLAKAEGLTGDQAHALAAEGKAIVWIDAGLHANETVTSQGQIQVLYRMLTQTDAETRRMLDDTIILFAHDNPDGMEFVSDWYMRNVDPKKREFGTLPRLFQKYAGHDNNRDSFMAQLAETENINRQMFRVWYPQIIYNQHQTGPAGMVVFVPPFRDPFNFHYDPIVMTELDELGSAMHSRLIEEGKAGSGMRSAAAYSTWHNGMVRSVSYFHNSIGLLTEIIGGPTPATIPLIPSTQLARGDEPLPVAPQAWHLQQSLDYQWTLNRAVIDYASRNRERLLFNIYRMGANSIARGSEDSWTITPATVAALQAAPALKESSVDEYGRPRTGPKRVDPALYGTIAHAPDKRDPRGYILSADQPDMPTTIAFLNALIKNGVDVERATASFAVAGKTYPAGSFIVKTAQAYRPHILDMFEPQDHPHDLEYPGGPPKAPYDITGYTLAFQMGVKFDRILDGFDGPFDPVPDLLAPPPGHVVGQGTAGWLISHRTNNGFILTNRLLKAGIRPAWLTDPVALGTEPASAGAVWIPASSRAAAIVTQATRELGIDAFAQASTPAGPQIALKPVRIGLVDRYGGLISSGWTRWILEHFEFPYALVFPKRLDAGRLRRNFDVLVFTDGAIPAPTGSPWKTDRSAPPPKPETIPAQDRPLLGVITEAKTVPAVKHFVEDGGAVVAVGGSTRLAELIGAHLAPALSQDKGAKALDTKQFYIPGSLLQARIDNREPLAYGLPDHVDVFFDKDQSFTPAASATGVHKVGWFDGPTPLRSGWAIGQERLVGTIALAEVDLGKGKLFVLSPEVTQRAQSYATFKLFFNGLLFGGAQAPAPVPAP
ncbi:M14 metallopeptidase family protein [Sphingomonas oligophenolica]|uniref:M14 metallopeptidase family protein n=1 Tax=Sphingomonas oligophenolica TaxID=301154 RepID=A0ABU9XWU3_9SPHN